MLFLPWLSSFAKRSLAQWSALSAPPLAYPTFFNRL